VYVESGYNVVRVSMRIVLGIGPPSYTILVRSCVSHSDTQERTVVIHKQHRKCIIR